MPSWASVRRQAVENVYRRYVIPMPTNVPDLPVFLPYSLTVPTESSPADVAASTDQTIDAILDKPSLLEGVASVFAAVAIFINTVSVSFDVGFPVQASASLSRPVPPSLGLASEVAVFADYIYQACCASILAALDVIEWGCQNFGLPSSLDSDPRPLFSFEAGEIYASKSTQSRIWLTCASIVLPTTASPPLCGAQSLIAAPSSCISPCLSGAPPSSSPVPAVYQTQLCCRCNILGLLAVYFWLPRASWCWIFWVGRELIPARGAFHVVGDETRQNEAFYWRY